MDIKPISEFGFNVTNGNSFLAISGNWTLHADANRLELADGSPRVASNGNAIFEWSETGFTWDVDDTVQLKLTAPVITATLENPQRVERDDGKIQHTFEVKLSERIWIPYRDMRDHAFTVTNGEMVGAKRLDKKRRRLNGRRRTFSDHWEMTVEADDSGDDITVQLLGKACDQQGALCTPDGANLLEPPDAITLDVTELSVSIDDASGDENKGEIDFKLSLGAETDDIIKVDFRTTTEGTATSDVDYRSVNATRVIFPGAGDEVNIRISLFDDEIDDDGETFIVQISNARVVEWGTSRVKRTIDITDDKATGTINNADALPRAMMARFGRTAAVHVVDHVEERLQAPREPGFDGRFAGRELRRGMEQDVALDFLSQLGGSAGMNPAGGSVHDPLSGATAAGARPLGMPGHAGGGHMAAGGGQLGLGAGPMDAGLGPHDALGGGGLLDRGFGGGDILTGSEFALSRETGRGGILSFWSRGAQSSFHGREGALALDGAVRTTMFGADYAKGPLVMGLSLANSRGLGSYAGVDAGRVASSVTGLYPWLGYKATDRITVWGVSGYGAGGLLLTPDGGPALESGLSMAMAAAGTRGELIAGGAGGFGLAFKADALWVGTTIDGVDGPAGRLKETDAAVTRFRTALEGSRRYVLMGRLSLKPSMEIGLRHDGGDAEEGSGVDVGGGIVVFDPASGLSADVRVRMLLVHEAEGFSERGVSVSISYSPTPATPLGFTARVAPSWGGQAMGGAQALWSGGPVERLAAYGGHESAGRLDADLGYGLPVGSRFVGTPRVGFGTSEYGRDYRVGYSLRRLINDGTAFELGVDAQRRENAWRGGTDNGVLGRASVGW